jgi:hypothetical protein
MLFQKGRIYLTLPSKNIYKKNGEKCVPQNRMPSLQDVKFK